jgi:hypothetical protein
MNSPKFLPRLDPSSSRAVEFIPAGPSKHLSATLTRATAHPRLATGHFLFPQTNP